jgi:hypothetical protein
MVAVLLRILCIKPDFRDIPYYCFVIYQCDCA